MSYMGKNTKVWLYTQLKAVNEYIHVVALILCIQQIIPEEVSESMSNILNE